MEVCPKVGLSKWRFVQMEICPNGGLSIWGFDQMEFYRKGLLLVGGSRVHVLNDFHITFLRLIWCFYTDCTSIRCPLPRLAIIALGWVTIG